MKALILLALALALPLPAAAQLPCIAWPAAVEQLADKWGEAPMWEGTRDGLGAFVVLANPDGTTWTLMLRRPDGAACPVASGEGWAPPAAPKPGEEG